MAKQGHSLSEDETRQIIVLLASTDLTMSEIATRMQRSPSAVASVNRRYRVRNYAGHRGRWTVDPKKMS